MLNQTKAEEILAGLFGCKDSVTLYTQCWLGLSLGDPGDDGSAFKEPEGNDYRRVLIGKTVKNGSSYVISKQMMSTSYEGETLNRTFKNNETIYFDEAIPEAWSTAENPVTHFGLFDTDDLSETVPYMWGKLTGDGVVIPANTIPIFRKGCFEVSIKDE